MQQTQRSKVPTQSGRLPPESVCHQDLLIFRSAIGIHFYWGYWELLHIWQKWSTLNLAAVFTGNWRSILYFCFFSHLRVRPVPSVFPIRSSAVPFHSSLLKPRTLPSLHLSNSRSYVCFTHLPHSDLSDCPPQRSARLRFQGYYLLNFLPAQLYVSRSSAAPHAASIALPKIRLGLIRLNLNATAHLMRPLRLQFAMCSSTCNAGLKLQLNTWLQIQWSF